MDRCSEGGRPKIPCTTPADPAVQRNNPDTVYKSLHAIFVLDELVPEFRGLIKDMMHPDPSRRPSASDALQNCRTLRDHLSPMVRFSPKDGYPELDDLRASLKSAGNRTGTDSLESLAHEFHFQILSLDHTHTVVY